MNPLARADTHRIPPTHSRFNDFRNIDVRRRLPVNDSVNRGFRGVCDTVLTKTIFTSARCEPVPPRTPLTHRALILSKLRKRSTGATGTPPQAVGWSGRHPHGHRETTRRPLTHSVPVRARCISAVSGDIQSSIAPDIQSVRVHAQIDAHGVNGRRWSSAVLGTSSRPFSTH